MKGPKCRCPICGAKNADSNHVRKSFIECGLGRDEAGFVYGAKDKRHSRKVRRLRERRVWLAAE